VGLRSEQFAQAFDAAEVSFVNGVGCFYLDTNVSAATLHDDVDFVAVLVSQVMEGQAFCQLLAQDSARSECLLVAE
jgi:hypothetical protein